MGYPYERRSAVVSARIRRQAERAASAILWRIYVHVGAAMSTAIAWTRSHPILTWSIAWGLTGVGLLGADVFSLPRQGPLWTGVVFGLFSWSIAGAVTFPQARIAAGLTVWSLAYVLAFWLGAMWGGWFERNAVGSVSSAGFVGALLGWAAGAAFGVLASEYLSSAQSRNPKPVIHAFAWALGFLLGGYLALLGGMVIGQSAVLLFPALADAALYVGWGLGSALGGALASALGLAAGSFLIKASKPGGAAL